MAIDFTHPQISDNYSTGYTAGIIANQIAQAQWLDSVQTSITAGVTQYMKRYNRTSLLLEEYNGSAWVNLALNYATLIYSNSFTGLQNITTSGAATTLNLIDTGGNGANLKLTGNLGSKSIRIGATTNNLEVVNSAYSSIIASLTDAGIFSCTSFSGAGTGLTGTAASLTAGLASALIASSNYTANFMYAAQFIGTGNLYPFSAVNGSGSTWYKAAMICDGTNFYFAPSAVQTSQSAANGAAAGTFRPFGYNMTNGVVTIDGTAAGVNFGGGFSAVATSTIASTSANSALQLKMLGGTSAACLQLINTQGGATNANKFIRVNGTGGLEIVNNAYSSVVAAFDDAGNFTAAATVSGATITQTSDETKKKNWEAPDSRGTVRALSKMQTWGNFDFIESGIKSLGVGAQSIRKIPAFKNAIHGDKKTGLTMNYGGAAMVAAIALSKELEALRSRVALLEAA